MADLSARQYPNLREYFDGGDKDPGTKIINLKHDFASEWHKLIYPNKPADGNVLELKITRNLFPYRDKLHTLKINTVTILARCSNNGDYDVTFHPPLPAPPPAGADQMTLTPVATYGNLHFATRDTSGDGIELDFSTDVIWNLMVESPSGNNLEERELEDMYLILGYE